MNIKQTGKRTSIDLNADLGEGLSNDAALMPFISSANISCGFHAGNREIMLHSIGLCLQNKVAIGAHPGYADRENFGRVEKDLTNEELFDLITRQLTVFKQGCATLNTGMQHIKPHGALYNQSARDIRIATAIAAAVYAFDPSLVLFGMSGSHSISEARKAGLKTASEVFADRTYAEDGSLTSRKLKGALIEDTETALTQVKGFIERQQVQTLSGKWIPVVAETICLHGDAAHAVSFARKINQSISAGGIRIQSI